MIRFSYYVVLISLVFSIQGLSAQKLSKTEKRLIQTIEQNNTEAIAFLEQVVNVNSGTLNAKGVKEVGMHLSLIHISEPTRPY